MYYNNNSKTCYIDEGYIEGLYYYYYYCVNSGCRHMCRQNGDGAIARDVL